MLEFDIRLQDINKSAENKDLEAIEKELSVKIRDLQDMNSDLMERVAKL